MSRTVLIARAILVGFVAGVIVSLGAFWVVQAYVMPPTVLEVRGVVQFQAQPPDPTATGNPPNGYFVESTAVDRFYLEGDLLEPYVGARVLIRGTVATVCGSETYPCYPKLLAQSIVPVP
ncbi:MAG TPA: hypothetical protein V6C88_10695 [Chroococcidiopsis sp.]